MKASEWHNCYNEGWKDVIVPEAFSHPAKMAYGLLRRILEHGKIQGWLKEGDVIVDPFGGIGSTGILGAYEGYQCVCCELEEKFVKLAEQNFELHKDAWVEFGNPSPVILQGDSRQLCQIVEKADCIISSPPFAGNTGGHGKASENAIDSALFKRHLGSMSGIKSTPGQLGSMKPGKVDTIISSPPYAEGLGHGGKPTRGAGRTEDTNLDSMQNGYGKTKGNLGNLKSGDVDAIISSPPWQNQEPSHAQKDTPSRRRLNIGAKPGAIDSEYGSSKGQLGNQQGDTFWQAAKEIVQQCYQILKPGGHAIWVVKSFVRNKKIVDFPGDWQKLCESVGFKTVCVHHAMLVKKTEHQTLFGDTETKRKERKSFFRRLAESKGSPRIDYEVVLCMSKR